MEKHYCPVKIKNPNSKDSLVRLLNGQKIHIVFDERQYDDYKLDLTGAFLSVDEVTEVRNGWMVSVAQKTDLISYFDSTLFLGGINFFDSTNQNKASLCVVSSHENNDYLRVVNPNNVTCSISPSQVLDVVFHSGPNEKWDAFPSGKDICVELIQHYIRGSKNFCSESCDTNPLMEHFFRFRFNRKSIEYLSELPYAKHDGGHIIFTNSKNQHSVLRLTCVWRGKTSIYKALLLPRIPVANTSIFVKKQGKKCMRASVTIEKIESKSLEDGCNVLLAKMS